MVFDKFNHGTNGFNCWIQLSSALILLKHFNKMDVQIKMHFVHFVIFLVTTIDHTCPQSGELCANFLCVLVQFVLRKTLVLFAIVWQKSRQPRLVVVRNN
ncbi:hypothetical protein J6590_040299 [Homalodisca vitripennis]|nr:hypothetical protein J6590_040299 [Homalodisca vitripennis]